jgi:hypothetical protein
MVGEILLYILVNGYMGTVISGVRLCFGYFPFPDPTRVGASGTGSALCLVKGKNKYCSFLFLEGEVNVVFVLL